MLIVGKELRRNKFREFSDGKSREDRGQQSFHARSSQRPCWCNRAFLVTFVGDAPNVALIPVRVGKTLVGAQIFTEGCVFYNPNNGTYRGRDEIDRIAGTIKATHPDFQYQPIAEPDVSGDGGRIRWVSGRPGEAPAYAGTDFIVAREGRIAAVYLFFDTLP